MLRKLLFLLVLCVPLGAQAPWNGNVTILGSFDMTSGTWSSPFPPVSSDPTGSCSNALSVVINTTTGHSKGCIGGTWRDLGVTPDTSGNISVTSVSTTGAGPGLISLTVGTFAQLPASPVEGMIQGVTNANTNTWGATISGTGANHVLAYYDGTNWTVLGK